MSGEYYNPYGSMAPEPLYRRKPPESPAPPLEPPEKKSKPAHKSKLNKSRLRLSLRLDRKWLISITCVLLLAIVCSLCLKLLDRSVLPASIAKQLKITAYIPRSLPRSYKLDSSSFNLYEGSSLTFNILRADGAVIGVSEQTLPSSLDLNAPLPKSIKYQNFDSQIGRAQIRVAGSNSIGYIAAGKTLITLNLGNMSAAEFQTIANDFKKN